jgi:hypothetical protein
MTRPAYYRFTTKARMDKAVNSLRGIVEGIAIDREINKEETAFFANWLSENREVANCHPFDELAPVVVQAIKDGILSRDERDNILYLCENLSSTNYYNDVTAQLQALQALLAGLAADDVIKDAEILGLQAWLNEHSELRSCWPFDEIDSLVTSILADHRITKQEKADLLAFCAPFAAGMDGRPSHAATKQATLPTICAVAPEIIFDQRVFCFTGESGRATRREMMDLAVARGARVVGDVSHLLDYLIVGGQGNPAWAYACYGRKIEKVLQLRKQGSRILIVHEADFFDAVA